MEGYFCSLPLYKSDLGPIASYPEDSESKAARAWSLFLYGSRYSDAAQKRATGGYGSVGANVEITLKTSYYKS